MLQDAVRQLKLKHQCREIGGSTMTGRVTKGGENSRYSTEYPPRE